MNVRSILPIPKVGPALYSVRGLENLAIGNGVTVGPIAFQFPRAVFVTGLQLVPLSGSQADAAKLALRVVDELQSDFFFDGLGQNFTFPALAMGGLSAPRVFPFQRPVAGGDRWNFYVTNNHSGALTVASLGIAFNEGLQ